MVSFVKKKLMIFSAFRNKKRYILYTTLIMLIFILCFILCINYNYYNYQINYIIGGKEINRGLVLYYENEKIQNLVNEIKYIDSFSPLYNEAKIKYNGKVYKINSNFQKNIIYGKNIEKDDELIISMLFFKNMGLEESDIGNTSINLLLKGKNYKFLIVGVTDDNHCHFYINNDSVENILELCPSKYYLLVNSYNNVSKVIKSLTDKDYFVEYYDSGGLYEIEDVQSAKKTYLYLCLLIIICLMIFFKSIINNIVTSETKNISLYKAIGFKNKYIKNIIIKRIAIILNFSYLLALGLTLIVSILINKQYITLLSSFIYVSVINILGILILMLSGFNISKKVKKINMKV